MTWTKLVDETIASSDKPRPYGMAQMSKAATVCCQPALWNSLSTDDDAVRWNQVKFSIFSIKIKKGGRERGRERRKGDWKGSLISFPFLSLYDLLLALNTHSSHLGSVWWYPWQPSQVHSAPLLCALLAELQDGCVLVANYFYQNALLRQVRPQHHQCTREIEIDKRPRKEALGPAGKMWCS